MGDLRLVLAAGLSALATLASIVGLLSIMRRRRAQSQAPSDDVVDEPLPYRQVEALLTPSERALYFALRPVAVAQGADVFAKVHLDDLVQVRKGAADYEAQRKRISACCIDFLLCERERLVPMLAVQMDGSGRGRASRREHNEFLGQVLGSLGLPIVHIATQSSYDPDEVAALVIEQIGQPQTVTFKPAAGARREPVPINPWLDLPPASETPGSQSGFEDAPVSEPLDSPAADINSVHWAEEPAGSPAADVNGIQWAEEPAGSPAADVDGIQWAEEPAGSPAADEDSPAPEQLDSPAVDVSGIQWAEEPASSPAADEDSPAPEPLDSPAADVDSIQWAEEPADEGPHCPACGQPLVEMQDVETGVIVLACSRYPDCPHVQAR